MFPLGGLFRFFDNPQSNFLVGISAFESENSFASIPESCILMHHMRITFKPNSSKDSTLAKKFYHEVDNFMAVRRY